MNLKKFFSAPTNEPIRDKKAERNLFARRTLVAFIGILALSGVLFANIYHLQVVNYDMYQTRSNGNRIKLLPLPPTRGLIYDRYGELLAENLTFFGLYIVPEKTENGFQYVMVFAINFSDSFSQPSSSDCGYAALLISERMLV